jgi:hypothetical protein
VGVDETVGELFTNEQGDTYLIHRDGHVIRKLGRVEK